MGVGVGGGMGDEQEEKDAKSFSVEKEPLPHMFTFIFDLLLPARSAVRFLQKLRGCSPAKFTFFFSCSTCSEKNFTFSLMVLSLQKLLGQAKRNWQQKNGDGIASVDILR